MLVLLTLACFRPSSDYDVGVYANGTELDAVLPAPEPMGGVVEVARMALWGHNIGFGVTGLFGDSPRADGKTFVLGNASFAWPPDPSYDRTSGFLRPGPDLLDTCVTTIGPAGYAGGGEYVDVGDAVMVGDGLRLERDPARHPRPAGESWYVAYGGALLPALTGHDSLPDTWISDAEVPLSFPGTVVPPESTLGSIPAPLAGATMRFPAALEGLAIEGEPVRAPHHFYDDDGVYDGVTEDAVRFSGPLVSPTELTWEPAGGQPVTVSVRVLGWGVEEDCDCDNACSEGFTCEDGGCVADDGATWNVLGETTCTLTDDGSFVLGPEHVQGLSAWIPAWEVAGALLIVGRVSEGTVTVPDVLTSNGKRVTISPVRTRAADLVLTRVEVP